MRKRCERGVGRSAHKWLGIWVPVLGLSWASGCGDDDAASPGGGGAGAAGMAGARSGGGGAAGSAVAGSTSAGSGGTPGDAGAGGSAGADAGAGGVTGGEAGAAGGGGQPSACTQLPASGYDGASFYTNTGGTTEIQTLVTAMASLTAGSAMPPGLMTVAEKPVTTAPAPVPPTAEEMLTAFEAGTPSLSLVVPAAFRTLSAALFVEHAEASLATWDEVEPVQWNWLAAPNNEGGVWHSDAEATATRIFNERALETRQLFEKGAFSAVFYNYVLELLHHRPTRADIDVIARAFGVDNPALPIAPDTVPAGTYTRTASYAYQVGLLTPVKQALIRGQTYAADPDCSEELDQALQDILVGWERGSMARVIYYTSQAISKLQTVDDREEDEAVIHAALHQLSEGLGLAIGWKGIDGKVISEAELDALLALLQISGLPAMDEVNVHALLGENAIDLLNAVSDLDQAIEQIQDVYQFTEAELANFTAQTPNPG